MTYISLIIFWYWFGVYQLIRSTKHRSVSLLVFLGLTIFFFLDKSVMITYFQWCGFFDLLYTWLTSQSLWIVFMLLFMAQYVKKDPSPYILWLFASLAFLSHLIIWPVTFFLWLLYILYSQNKKHIYIFLLSIGITSFFWLPFAAFSSLSIPSLIVFNPPILLLIISLLLLFVAFKNKIVASMLLLAASILIISPNYFSSRWSALTGSILWLPLFHYYRFASLALLFLIVWWFTLFDPLYAIYNKSFYGKKNYIVWSLVGLIWLSIIVFHFGLIGFDKMSLILNEGESTPQITELDKIQKDYAFMNDGRKIFTIDSYRPIGFWIDSYFQYQTPWLPFVKWLFWESSRGNQLLCSYVASLLSPKDVVLDHYVMRIFNQTQYNNLWDWFIHEYNMWWIISAPKEEIPYITWSIAKMMFTTFASWTLNYDFVPKDHVLIQWIQYTIYQIVPKNTYSVNWFIRPFTKYSEPIRLVNDRYFADQILLLHKSTPLNAILPDYIYFDSKNFPYIPVPFWSSSEMPKYSLLGQDTYKIDLWSTPQSVIVTLPDLPGRSVKGIDGQEVSVYDGVLEKIISWTWVVILSYHKPSIIIFAYILSLFSSATFAYFVLKKRQ